MSLSYFFLITAIISIVFGLATLLAPSKSLKNYGFDSGAEGQWMFRIFGGMILSAGVLNFMIRNSTDTEAIQAVLIFNAIFYFIRILNDLSGWKQKLFPLNKIYMGELIHLIILSGSLYYLFTL